MSIGLTAVKFIWFKIAEKVPPWTFSSRSPKSVFFGLPRISWPDKVHEIRRAIHKLAKRPKVAVCNSDHVGTRVYHRTLSGSLVLLAALLATGCAESKLAHDIARHRLGDGDATVLLVSTPNRLRVVTRHPTLAGGEETTLETRLVKADLTGLAEAWAPAIAGTLRSLRDTHFVSTGKAGAWVSRVASDPRRDGLRGRRLLFPYRQPPRRDSLALPPPSEKDLDDRGGRTCLVRGEFQYGPLPELLWYSLDPQRIQRKFNADQLLLVSLEYVAVFDTGGKPEVRFQVASYAVQLRRELLSVAAWHDFDGGANGPAGETAALAPDLAALQAGDWRALRAGLRTVGGRYGFVLAHELGWIDDERLDEERRRWRRENAAQLEGDLTAR